MKIRRFGIRARFIVLIVALQLVTFTAVSLVLITINTHSLKSSLTYQARSFAQLATKPIGDTFITYMDSGRIRITQEIQSFADINPNISNVAVIDTAGKLGFSQNANATVNIDQTTASTFDPVYINDKSGNLARVVAPYFEDSGQHRYSIVYDISSTSIQDSIHRQIVSTLLFSVVGLIISFIAAYSLINYFFIDPIQRVSRQALVISAGNIDQQIKLEREDEVGDLAQAVNKMTDSLKDDIRKLREIDQLKSEFLIIASHNLRTPLTIIDGNLDLAELAKKPADLKRALEAIKSGSSELKAFTEDILTISQVEAGRPIGNRENVRLADMATDLATEYAKIAAKKFISFESSIEHGSYQVNINKFMIRNAIWNLLDNAIKFTPEKGSIKFECRVLDGRAVVNVSDTGIGIKSEEMPKLFTKFHRGTELLAYNYPGAGIGLYSSKIIVEQHGGEIRAESKLGQGSRFTITLPLISLH